MKEKYVWLSKLEISNVTKFNLIKKFNGIENLYNCSLDDLVSLEVNDKLIKKILDIKTRENSKKDYEFLEKNNIDIIWYENKFYPKNFNNINDKPVCFYIKGNKEILNNYSIGIVGSRKASQKSLDFTRNISRELSLKNITIVSGLARGVDKFAHLGALDVKNIKNRYFGTTIAVLGSGINVIYPYENKMVYERIINQNGAIISEYPIGTSPLPYNFPYRNRLISGLSSKIIVVEASLKSGSLITVDYALDQGKDIFVYKNEDIEKDNFSGNKLLIEQGAEVLEI